MGVLRESSIPKNKGYLSWSAHPAISTDSSWAYNMSPSAYPIIKQGDEVKFEFKASTGTLTMKCKETTSTNTMLLKGQTIYPFIQFK